jgi:hypothetical protein
MPEITLLGSIHKENGRCSSAEMARILEHIQPEVLFQEVPFRELLGKNYSYAQTILEIRAISEHLKRHTVLQIPVDTLAVSPHEDEKFNRTIDRVSRASQEFRSLWDDAQSLKNAGGFEYLNSRSNDALLRRSDRIIMRTLQELNDERLAKGYAEWKNHNSKRDDAMISNIYEFCRQSNFKKGVFLFGSGHRQSLIRKIRTVRKKEAGIINWKLGCGVSGSGVGRA